jgi:type IV secretory pathway VirB10-like protein
MSNDVVEPQTINPTSTMPQQHQVKPKLTPHIPPVEDEEPEAQDEDEEEAAADEEEDNEENEAEEEADEEDNEEDEGEDETNAIFKNGDLIGLRVGVNGRYLSCDEQGSVVGSKELFEFTVVLEDDSEIRYGTKISLLSQNTGKFLCAYVFGLILTK